MTIAAPLTHRLIPNTAKGKTTVNGRTYDPSLGAQDVPEFDATHLQANGWVFLAPSGPTANRPSSTVGVYPRLPGVEYWDTTLSHLVVWDGVNWRNEAGTIS